MSFIEYFQFWPFLYFFVYSAIKLKWPVILTILLFLQLLKFKSKKCAENFDFPCKKWFFGKLNYFLKNSSVPKWNMSPWHILHHKIPYNTYTHPWLTHLSVIHTKPYKGQATEYTNEIEKIEKCNKTN